MTQKQILFKIKGMQRDLSNSVFSKEYAFENMNIRINADTDNGLLSITNEKGTRKLSTHNDSWNLEVILGFAELDKCVVLFGKTAAGYDTIGKIEYDPDGEDEIRYTSFIVGDLSFSTEHPIETLVDIENENIQKVYWVDGINQPRVINIAGEIKTNDNTQFDFVPSISGGSINVEHSETAGQFPAGVIQYVFTYFNKFGAESAVVDVSPIYYIADEDKGVAPNETVNKSFKVSFTGLDNKWEYIRLYSIIRTSINTTPEVRKVVDLKLTNNISYTDTGALGEYIAPTDLLYKGGEVLAASTITSKDGTLFLGDINIKNTGIVDKELKEYILKNISFTFEGETRQAYKLGPVPNAENEEYYLYTNHLNSNNQRITTFKNLETYRIGIQLQDIYGKWSDPIFIGDYKNTIPPHPGMGYDDYNEIAISTGSATTSSELNNRLTSLGFINIRPLIVFPSEAERECICQGVLCPTVFNVKDRVENSPYVQSSWYVRPNSPKTNTTSSKTAGVGCVNKHYSIIPAFNTTVNSVGLGTQAEFISEFDLPSTVLPDNEFMNREDYLKNYSNAFFIDKNIVTLHSPEIEFNNNFLAKDLSKCSLRIIGIAPINASTSDIFINYKNVFSVNEYAGLNKIKIHNYNSSSSAYRQLINGNFWWDNYHYINEDQDIDYKYFTAYRVGLWNPSHQIAVSPDITNEYVLDKNRHFVYHISNNNTYFSNPIDKWKTIDLGVYHKTSPGYVKVGKYYYSGNVDKIITSKASTVWHTDEIKTSTLTPNNISEIITGPSVNKFVKEGIGAAISITYDSSSHCVISLGDSGHGQWYIEPSNSPDLLEQGVNDGDSFWEEYLQYQHIEDFTLPDNYSYGYLFVGELYQEVDNNSRFGGTSDYAIQNNLWLPAGNAVTIGLPITWTEGDTYYQRYDHIKTMPRNDQDLNGVTSVISFMCETRINLDGRYDDRYKAVEDGLSLAPEKFNQLNEAYSQSNNFFNYRVLDTERFGINKFPNTIVWSKTKYANNIVDNWLNINLASSLDLDGNKGKVTALKVFNDNIISFQEKGISQILFNSRVQINTSDSVPIEIANSGKVDGKRYLGNNIGCLNKHSICNSPNGLYFIDDYNKSIYLFNGEFSNLSGTKGFHSWMKNNSSLNVWTPKEFNNAVTYRDPINNEVLFIYKDKCLAFNEILGEFSSFYSYEDTPYMFTLNDKNIMYHKDNKNLNDNKNLWVKNEGEYNNFFGVYKDFYTTVIANDNPTYDKIFSTLDFRADVLDDNNKMIKSTPTAPFNHLKIVNEYQEVESNLSGKSLIPKFRVWRAQFPRLGKNRIRNTWATITLGNLVKNRKGINKKVRLHDMVVNYFI